MDNSPLKPFFAPTGVAVIGASHDPTKLGYGLARNLLQSNFKGAIYFVNSKGGALFGQSMLTNIMAVPEPLDLGILLIPAQTVPGALEECGRRGLRAVIIGSGGFRETDAAGAALEEQCLEIARSFGIRLLGPNCIGLLDTHLPMDVTFLPPPGPPPGDVAFISHSGAICAAVIDWARGHGFGLSHLVSLGNQVDVNETDVLEPVANDPFTRVLTLYLEGIRNGRRFIAEAQKITRHKPLIALKVGRFESGQRAVASHTGALAGQESAYNAAFRRAGVIRAETSEEMFDWARALAWCPPARGKRIAVLTNAGGPGVTAADALESHGMCLAELDNETRLQLAKVLPAAASLNNPVDMLASASPEQYAFSLKALLEDAGVDGVMVILPPPPMFAAGAVARAMIPIIHQHEKPVVVALMGEKLIQEAVEHLRAAHIPEYRFPERAASALAVLSQRAESLARLDAPSVSLANLQLEKARHIFQVFQENHPTGGWLPPEVITEMMSCYGIHVPPIYQAKTQTEACKLAEKVGFPVVLKIASPDISHKSDVGGVIVNLWDEKSVEQGFVQIMDNVRKLRPGASLQGVSVQHMMPPGQDVIIGAIQDAQFGALIMFGSGGVETEGLKDVAFALAPLTDEETEHMIETTWAGRKLKGYRNLPPADRQAVKETLQRLAQFSSDFPEIKEIEINPLRALTAGKGVFALDVRARTGVD